MKRKKRWIQKCDVDDKILPIPTQGDSDWGYAGVPVVGPLIGGALAGIVTRVLQWAMQRGNVWSKDSRKRF